MTRDEFRQSMNNFKKARENNPQLSYWKWKANKYQDGTDYVNDTNLPEIVVTPVKKVSRIKETKNLIKYN